MIKQAKNRRMGNNVGFLVADVMRLPFADASKLIVRKLFIELNENLMNLSQSICYRQRLT